MQNKKSYFFVRGFMRSGTNWVGNLLNLHPDICVTGEYHLHRLQEAFERITNPEIQPYSLLMYRENRTKATRCFERFIRSLIDLGSQSLDKPEATILGDRTPAPLNRRVIRNAKRVHVVRDGRDCLVSMTLHFLRFNEAVYPFENFPSMQIKREEFHANPEFFSGNPHQLLDDESWVRSRVLQWSRRYLADRKTVDRHGDRILSMHYEDIHLDTDAARKKMYEFLGADPDRAEKLDEKTTAGFETENTLSHYRKGQVGDWKKYFTPEVSRWFVEESKGALEIAGYEPDSSWAQR